jgi:hypothetical protein
MLAAMVIHGLLSLAFLAKLSHELSQHSRYALGFSAIAQLTRNHIISLFAFNVKFDQRVQKGTNGGVTIDGLLAAAAAGFSIGLAFVLIGFLTTQCASDIFWRQLLVIPLATAAGLCGSLIDSILGATVQYSGFCSVRKKVFHPRLFEICKCLHIHPLIHKLIISLLCMFALLRWWE